MKPRLPILGAVVLVLVLAFCQSRQRGSGSDTPEPAATPARATAATLPPHASIQAANRAARTVAQPSVAGAVPGASRFEEALGALPATMDTDDWTPTLDRLANSVLIAELGSSVRELVGAEADSPGAMLRERLLARWTGLAPEAASAWTVGIADPVERGESLVQVAVAWARADPTAAAAWASSLPGENERHELLLHLAYEAVSNEPVRALDLAAELPAGDSRDELLAQALGNWATRDPQGAVEWARSLGAGPGRARALESVVANWAGTDAIAAAECAMANLPRGDALDRAVVAVVERWAQNDPKPAAEWIEGFEAGALQSAAADNLMANWCAHDFQGPANWLESLPSGPLRDMSIASYARQLASADEPSLAAGWVSLMADTELRRRAEVTVAVFNRAARPQ